MNMSPEQMFAGITIVANLIMFLVQLRMRKFDAQQIAEKDRLSRLREALSTIQDSASQILNHTFILAFNPLQLQELSTMVSVVTKSKAKLHSLGAVLKDEQLDFAIGDFLRTVDEYRAVVRRDGLNSDRSGTVGGQLYLSYLGVIHRCTELAENSATSR